MVKKLLAIAAWAAALVLPGRAIANTHGVWFGYSGPNYAQVSVASTGYFSPITGFPAPAVACAVRADQATIDCYKATGTAHSPGHSGMVSFFGGNTFKPCPNNDCSLATQTIESFTVHGTSSGYTIYALRKDGAIFFTSLSAAMVPAPGWFTFVVVQPISMRRIVWAQGGTSPLGNNLAGVGINNNIYTIPGNGGAWSLYSSAPTVGLFGGDDIAVLSLAGSSGLSTTFGSFLEPQCPQATQGLPLSLADPNLAFTVRGKTTPVSCDFWGCYALTSRDTSGFGPDIYYSNCAAGSSWSVFPLDFTDTFGASPFGTNGGPWTISTASNYRGIVGDLFVIGNSYRLYEWVPF